MPLIKNKVSATTPPLTSGVEETKAGNISPFSSILFPSAADIPNSTLKSAIPVFFTDLNLDQIINELTKGKEAYNIGPFYYSGPVSRTTIIYRQQVMEDLGNDRLLAHLEAFADNMQELRKQQKQLDNYFYSSQKQRMFPDLAALYCKTVMTLRNRLSQEAIRSRGLLAFENYLNDSVQSPRFQSLIAEIKEITDELSSINYCISIQGLQVQVSKYSGETDYSAEVEETFARFKQGWAKDYQSDFSQAPSMNMNDVEARILDGVAQLYPAYFTRLDHFQEEYSNFEDKKISDFDREIQFYIAYLRYLAPLKQSGLTFCSPKIVETSSSIYTNEGFDLALAHQLTKEKLPVVTNDFYLKDEERIIVVTGPNQGGKTTFARTFGQLHYLAALGCPVPGREAQLSLYDKIFTHFEREETIKNLRGKLMDELIRIHAILEQTTPDSLIIINEIFTSTTFQNQLFLSRKIMEKISVSHSRGVWVTFIDELASSSPGTVSMVSSVDSGNPDRRTFKLKRRPADGLAYALSVAEKYQVTYDCLRERLNRR